MKLNSRRSADGFLTMLNAWPRRARQCLKPNAEVGWFTLSLPALTELLGLLCSRDLASCVLSVSGRKRHATDTPSGKRMRATSIGGHGETDCMSRAETKEATSWPT